MEKKPSMKYIKNGEDDKEELLKKLNELEIDNHYWQARPCPTCQGITNLIGKPFECVKLMRIKYTEKDKER